jgi:hypothetical protein
MLAFAAHACAGDATPARCPADQCDIAGACLDNLTPNPANPCEACLVLVDRTRFTPFDAATCDDGDFCTTADRCRDGLCTGSPVHCDDGDPCTVDACDPDSGACAISPSEKCGPDPCADDPDCDDDNPCTDDRCEPQVGCVSTPVAADPPTSCDDASVCTTRDVCIDGRCVGGAPLACDDSDLCTVDTCDPASGCRHDSIASLCTDDNPCTDERCEPADGCVYPFNTAPCDDANACTANDLCTSGACLGAPVPFDDANPCTDDACDPRVGPVHVPNTLPCSDGNACTVGDRCADTRCVPGTTPLDCNDDNVCTDDSCNPASGCNHAPHTRACNDGTLCTADDRCADSLCKGTPIDCDDDNPCTTDACVAATGCKHTLIVSNACRPNIVVTFPPRGATLVPGPFFGLLTASGNVTSGAGPITSFKVNGTETAVDPDGSWSVFLASKYGGNILNFEATDSFGSKRAKVQSYLYSKTYRHPTTPKNGIVGNGIGVWLDKLAIDDGNRSSPPNDLASILQIAIRAFDIPSLIPRPAANNIDAVIAYYDVYINNLTFSPAVATLKPQAGGIHLNAKLNNGRANIRAARDGCRNRDPIWGECVDVGPSEITGTVTWTSLTIDVDLDFSVVNNDIRVTVRSSAVNISGLNVSIDGAFGWLADFVLGFFLDDFANTIETQFNAQLAPVIGPLVRDGLSALAFQVGFDLPKPNGTGTVPLDLVTDWSSITCDAEGCAIVLRAGAYTDTKRTPYTNDGVPARDNCGSGVQTLIIPEARTLELSIADDMLNELLFAAWRGGLLEFPVPAAWLQGTDFSQFGISNLSLSISGMLAPTASDCGGFGLEAHIGDLKVNASMKLFGQPVNFVVYASAFAGLQLYLDGNQVGIRMTNVREVQTEVEVLNPDLIALEPVIAGLIEDQVIAGLIAQLGGGDLGAFPLPDIDLSGAIAGLPAGTGIRIVPENLSRQGGNTIAGGRLN